MHPCSQFLRNCSRRSHHRRIRPINAGDDGTGFLGNQGAGCHIPGIKATLVISIQPPRSQPAEVDDGTACTTNIADFREQCMNNMGLTSSLLR